jgi:mercuric ion binding protein
MKIITIIFIITTLIASGLSFAAGTRYELRVDGLACPFCAYGIEKKFTRTEGVESVDIDLKNGLVIVNTFEGTKFSEDELKTIIDDTGFTMKSMSAIPR